MHSVASACRSYQSLKPADLFPPHTHSSRNRSAPGVAVLPGSVRDTSAAAAVTGPAVAPSGGWARYDLVVCLGADPASCLAAQPCGIAGSTAGPSTTCTVANLAPYTNYTVAALAVAGSLRSMRSDGEPFHTRIS